MNACPPEVVTDLPRLTRSAIAHGLTSAEVDAAVVARLRAGESLYLVADRLLAELKPELLITRALCAVRAVSFATPPPSASRSACA